MIVVANFSELENSLLKKVAEDVGLLDKAHHLEVQVETVGEIAAACRDFAPKLPKTIIVNLDTDESVWTGLIRALKSDKVWRFVPVMGFSFLDDPGIVARFYAAGGASCIRKPHGYDGLCDITLKTMRYWLDVSFLPSDMMQVA